MAVTDKMLALRAEIHHEHEFMTIYIGDFNVRQAEKMANNKLDGHIVRSTKREGKANVCRRPGILLSPPPPFPPTHTRTFLNTQEHLPPSSLWGFWFLLKNVTSPHPFVPIISQGLKCDWRSRTTSATLLPIGKKPRWRSIQRTCLCFNDEDCTLLQFS